MAKASIPLPEKYALQGSEDAHQIALFCWSSLPLIREKYPELEWLFAIPNGGSRHKAEGAKLRAMGVKRGVLDICLPVKRGEFGALWIELKRPAFKGKRGGTTSPEQDKWIAFLRGQGYGACSCVGWEAAKDMIIQYLEYGK